ncbi:HYR domain-containing protein [Aureibacter tunicatorum]|uniref:Gliding motility-associated-like protein n=1 Tax=Aureibacter tunicatorum TaxID=866807 RepID=A0AAE4BT00_9BACT|nr:HYR domain-containing protein [Aureibacter tunicatorum]MDR6238947.1 gliding motility-associated-like protein [Aureibacter tunicatorum]BDD05127.1 hypothetical protein AUTU_26100 [Aureibacter tunicatorum]
MKNFLRLMLVFGALITFHQSANGQTTFTDGDIAFTRYNSDDETFSYVFLVDATASTEFFITDEGWNGTGFYSNESTIKFVVNSAISAGEEVHVTCGTMTYTTTSGATPFTMSSVGSFSPTLGNMLGSFGDNLFVFQTGPNVIAGLHADNGVSGSSGNAWFTSAASSTNGSVIPTGKTNASNGFIGLFPNGLNSEVDNARYKGGSLHTGDKATLLTNLMDYTKWEFDNGTPYGASSTAFTVSGSCTDPAVPTISSSSSSVCSGASVTLTITGSLNDATAWHVYTGSCGGTQIGTTTSSTINVSPTTTTTYFIRGEGGCVTAGSCGQVTVNVTADNTDPVITVCASTPSNLSANINCQAICPDLTGQVTATDNCTASPTITQSPAAGSTLGLGTTTITLTATDASGNTATCQVNQTVVDNTDPVITVCASTPANLSANINCQAVCPDLTGQVTATDNCTGSPTITQSPAAGSTLGLGTTTITLTATDGSGNTTTCQVNQTVVDDTDPVITVCASTPSNLSANSNCQAVCPDLTGQITATDNCTLSPAITQSPAAGSTLGLGTTTITLTATDGSGNTTTCQVNQTVVDDTDPVITVCASTPSNLSANSNCQAVCPDLTGQITATDNCTLSPAITQSPAAGSTLGLGTTTITLTATDGSGNTTTCQVNQTVVDDTDPVITVCASTPSNLSANGSCQAVCPDLTGQITATDNCTGSPTITQSPAAGSTLGLGTTTITLTATDGSGNTTTCQVNQTVVDDTDPVITVCASTPSNLSANSNCQAVCPDLTGSVTATDNCTGSPTITQSPAAGSTLGLGTTTITLTATDGSGNTTTCQVNQTVVDDTDPVITVCASTPSNLSANASCQAVCPDLTGSVTATDNCTGSPTITQSPAAGATLGLGTTTITLTATDGSGNTATCQVNQTVVDDTDPVITVCASTPANLSANSNCQAVCPDLTGSVTATDNCTGSPTITQSPAAGSTLGLGTTTITLTATDGSGNTATCQVNQTVVDDTDPVITVCASTPANLSANSNCQAVCPDLTGSVTATDNCTGSPTITQSPAAGSTLGLGTTTITLTATDGSGNTTTCQVNQTVVDDTDPVITVCASTPSNLSANSNCQAVCPDLTGQITATDNCTGSPTITQSPAAGSTLGLGTTTITLTATDGSGNTATCQVNQTVVDDTDPVITVCASTPSNLSANSNCQAVCPDLTGQVTATDNCTGSPTITQSPAAGSTLGLGTTTITLTATDGSGNTATCQVNQTVVDDTDPVITVCASTPSNLSANSNCQAVCPDLTGQVTATDNCTGSPTITQSPAAGSTLGLGTTTITLTATDGSGNTTTCQVNQTVVDDTDPVITVCASTPSNLSANSNCQAVCPDLTDQVTATDNCTGSPAITQSPAAGSTLGLGTTTITLTATDGSGNTTTCQVNQTVVDDTDPVITVCASTPSNLSANASCQAVCPDLTGSVTATDNCTGSPTITQSPAAGSTLGLGTTTITLTATDGSGNTATCQVNQTVVDDTDPVITVCASTPSNLSANSNCQAICPDLTGQVTATDNCTGSPTITQSPAAGSTLGLGTTTITLTATDGSGNTATCQVNQTVVDDTDPVITVCASTPSNLSANSNCQAVCPDLTGQVTATDNCTGSPTITQSPAAGSTLGLGTTTITLTATDGSGNTTTCQVNQTVVDATDPVITVCASTPSNLSANSNCQAVCPDLTGQVTATDNCTGSPTITQSPAAGSTLGLGTTTITLTATDGSGNTTTCQVNQTVVDDTDPVVITQDITAYLDINGNATISSLDINDGSTDNCMIQSFVLSDSIFSCADVGDNTITLNVIDASGNSNSETAIVSIVDDIQPNIVIEDQTVYLDQNGKAVLTAQDVDRGTSDACGIASISISQTIFNCDEVGSVSVVFEAEDVNGNTSTQSFNVQVVDQIKPFVRTMDIEVGLDENGMVSITADQVNDRSSDNCEVSSISVSPNSFTCDDLGDNEVVLTVTDNHGNIQTGTAKVKVEDTSAPVLKLKPLTLALDENGQATIVVSDLDDGTTDNCGSFSLSIDRNTFSCEDLGDVILTVTATDLSGNQSSEQITIVIEDEISPEITCSGNIETLISPYDETVSVLVPQPSYTDNCANGLTLVNNFNQTSDASGLYPLGLTTIVWTVSDSQGNSASCSMQVQVNEMQLPPVVDPIDELVVNEEEELLYQVKAMDPNRNPLDYSLSEGAIALGLSISQAGLLSWTPSEENGPNEYSFEVYVADRVNPELITSTALNIKVEEVNEVHRIQQVEHKVVKEGELVKFRLLVDDDDIPAQDFTFRVDSRFNGFGVKVDENSGEIEWIPGEDYGGKIHEIVFVVEDDKGVEVRSAVTIEVIEVDDPLIVDTDEDLVQNVDVGDGVPSLEISVIDPEGKPVSPQVITIETSPKGVVSESNFNIEDLGDGNFRVDLVTIDQEFVGSVEVKIIVDDGIERDPPQGDQSQNTYELVFEFVFEPRALPLDIPNIFTPNNDGKNDSWNIVNLSLYDSNVVRVFDQFGNLVFERENYSRDNEWDGTVRGKLAKDGTYYYEITVENKASYKGPLMIVK